MGDRERETETERKERELEKEPTSTKNDTPFPFLSNEFKERVKKDIRIFILKYRFMRQVFDF